MDINPFTIQYNDGQQLREALIRPCCKENVVDYAVWINNKLVFTITKKKEHEHNWVVAMKSADNHIDDTVVQNIGQEIDQRHNY